VLCCRDALITSKVSKSLPLLCVRACVAQNIKRNEVQDLKGLADPNEDRAERFKDRGVDMQDGMFPKSLKGLAAPQEENKKTTASAAKLEPTQANGEEDEYDQDEEAWDC